MTDRPIHFSAPMVRALLDGRKTQTRRVLRPQPEPLGRFVGFSGSAETARCKVRYAPGDRLWVREAHYMTDDGESSFSVFAENEASVAEHLRDMQTVMACHPGIDWSKHLRLRPSIHMPRWASRLTLKVTDVRVQRLREISEADAVAEGVNAIPEPNDLKWEHYSPHGVAFVALWNSIHGPGAWDANPWVCAITFTTHRCNIDQMEADHD